MEAAKESQDASPRNSDATESASRPHVDDRRPHKDPAEPARLKKATLLPGSDGEHALQVKYGAKDRALGFYGRQVPSFLSAAIAEEARTVRLDAVLGPPRRSVPVGDSSTPESRILLYSGGGGQALSG
jgi:hypothetical protein